MTVTKSVYDLKESHGRIVGEIVKINSESQNPGFSVLVDMGLDGRVWLTARENMACLDIGDLIEVEFNVKDKYSIQDIVQVIKDG